jgi:hypothetical protein
MDKHNIKSKTNYRQALEEITDIIVIKQFPWYSQNVLAESHTGYPRRKVQSSDRS